VPDGARELEERDRQRAPDAAEGLPENATVEDAIARLCFTAKVNKGIKELDSGLGVPHDAAKRRILVAEVVWSPQSLQDPESINSIVAGDSPHYAGLLVQKLVAAVELYGTGWKIWNGWTLRTRKKGAISRTPRNGALFVCTVNPVMVVRIHPPQPSSAARAASAGGLSTSSSALIETPEPLG
jgi:hypothetical protein